MTQQAPRLQRPLLGGGNKDPLAWAHALRRREQLCESLTKAQREAWRKALGYPPESDYLSNPRGDGT